MADFQLIRPLILASGSPRRRELMETLGFPFEVLVSEADESFHSDVLLVEVPAILAERKALAVLEQRPDSIILSADTVVILGNSILNKPADRSEAADMLKSLSGKVHSVYTAFCLASKDGLKTYTDRADVLFRNLTDKEITYYLDNGKPYDKAGSYGIQEWIGLVAVERIEGSFFTVMGLPVHLVWQKLNENFLV